MRHKGDDFECYPKAVLIAAETLVWDPLEKNLLSILMKVFLAVNMSRLHPGL
jgi:hypothetical protein